MSIGVVMIATLIDAMIAVAIFPFFALPFFYWMSGLILDCEEGKQRAKQERILEQKRGSNKKQINNADRRAAIQRKWKEIGKKNS